jgi:hypothetical protein
MKRLGYMLALVALFPAAACYSYHTIPVDDLQPDLPVRLRVKPEASEHVAQVTGYPTQDVQGRIVSLLRDTVLLAVRVPAAAQADVTQQLYQRLDIPVSQLIEVQQRQLNRTKTYVSVALAAAGAGALALWAFTSSTLLGSQSTPPVINNSIAPPPLFSPPYMRLPLGRLPLRR